MPAQPGPGLIFIFTPGAVVFADPGPALAVPWMGQCVLILDAACPACARVVAVAASLASAMHETRPPTPDPTARGTERRLGAWLRDSAPPLR